MGSVRERHATSSNVNEVIRAIVNFLIFFTRKFLSDQRAQNGYKQSKTKKAAFLCA